MSASLRRRLERLEAGSNAGEVTLEELILWSMRLGEERPLNAEEQRRYDECDRRLEESRICRLFMGSGSRRAAEPESPAASNRYAGATAIAAAVKPAATAPEPAPVSRADPVFEEHRPDELIKAVPGMRLDVLMALQRK